MVDIFNKTISLRSPEATSLVLPATGNKGTVTWDGNILSDDWVQIPGLDGCMGLICIASSPTKQVVNKKREAEAVSGSRSSLHREEVKDIVRKTQRYSQILADFEESKKNPRESILSKKIETQSQVEAYDVFRVYALHAMGSGHYQAKELLEDIFNEHPAKDSLTIYFWSCTDFGQYDWLAAQRGQNNIQGSSGTAHVKQGFLRNLYAGPKSQIRKVYEYANTNSAACHRPPELYGLKEHKLTQADGVKVHTEDSAKLMEKHDKHLSKISKSDWSRQSDECEICRRKVGSRFKTMFIRDQNVLSSRHHCRACGRTVCDNCATKASKIDPSKKNYITTDRRLTSYICIKCNSREW